MSDSQAMIVESLLTKMLIGDNFATRQLEEALSWFQADNRTNVSCPFERQWSRDLAEEIVRLLRSSN
jgi:hypothetical protein